MGSINHLWSDMILKCRKVSEMSNWNDISFVQHGWQCPVCGAVYSPMVMQCYNCTGSKLTTSTETTVNKEDEYIQSAHSKEYFHGEEWFECPNCSFIFGFFDAVFERLGIKRVEDHIYVCPECNKKFKIV